jgi:hypothetical protein
MQMLELIRVDEPLLDPNELQDLQQDDDPHSAKKEW